MSERPPRPVVDDAPGLTWRYLQSGWEARWRALPERIKDGFTIKSRKLWLGNGEPTDADKRIISDACKQLQGDMLSHGREVQAFGPYDSTLSGLMRVYKSDPVSPFPKLRYATRRNYDSMMGRIDRSHGDTMLQDINARTIHAWHADWSSRGRITSAHSLVGMLRLVFGFGLAFLEDEEGQKHCERLSVVLSKCRFQMGKPRGERITADQANAVRAMAWQMERPSIALGQAFQFECILRQKDVVGEWVPNDEPGVSYTLAGNEKWLRGLLWEEIDAAFVLRHVTSKLNKKIEVPLRLAPMVMEELCKLAGVASAAELSRDMLRARGPMVVCEYSDIPWTNNEFRRWWRLVANACGIPSHVFNMDTRAGAITEASEANAPMEHIRHAATHGNISMTERYSRGSAEKIANVLQIRSSHRNKDRTK